MSRLLTALFSLFLVVAPLAAFQPAAGQQNEFVPVTQVPQADQLPAAPLVIAAYAFVWVALMVYLWSIWRRLSRVEHDMQALARRAGERTR